MAPPRQVRKLLQEASHHSFNNAVSRHEDASSSEESAGSSSALESNTFTQARSTSIYQNFNFEESNESEADFDEEQEAYMKSMVDTSIGEINSDITLNERPASTLSTQETEQFKSTGHKNLKTVKAKCKTPQSDDHSLNASLLSNETFDKLIEDFRDSVKAEQRANALEDVPDKGMPFHLRKDYSLHMDKMAFVPSYQAAQARGKGAVQRFKENYYAQHRGIKYRKFWLMPLHDNWPHVAEGLTMESEEAPNGNRIFTMRKSAKYRGILEKGEAKVFSQRPMDVQEVLQSNPFHVDLLLHMARLQLLQEQDLATIMLVIQRAIYALEYHFSIFFSPFVANPSGIPQVSMDSTNVENLCVFTALWLYMVGLAHGGSTLAAYNVCKLLLCMDLPSDHCHALLHIDCYALLSRAYDAILAFSQSFIEQHSGYLLPERDVQTHIANAVLNSSVYTMHSNEFCTLQTAPQNFINTRLKLLFEFFYVSNDLENLDNFASKEGPTVAELRRKFSSMTENISNVALPKGITTLDIIMPNFAFSCAFASQQLENEALDIISISEVQIETFLSFLEKPEKFSLSTHNYQHLLLMRALLLFPSFLRYLLERLQIPANTVTSGSLRLNTSWATILSEKPFSNGYHFTHKKFRDPHIKIIQGYVEKCHNLWNSEAMLRLLHACSIQLTALYNAAEFTRGREDKFPTGISNFMDFYRYLWTTSIFLIDLNRYNDLELKEFSSPPMLPKILEDKRYYQLNPMQRFQDTTSPNVSLKSHPLIVFFVMLFPWSKLDYSGLHTEPLSLSSVFKRLSLTIKKCLHDFWAVKRNLPLNSMWHYLCSRLF